VGEDGSESLLGPTASTTSIAVLGVARGVRLVLPATVGAASYNIYKMESESSDVFGFIGSTIPATPGLGATFEDYNTAPDIGDGPPIERNPFAAAGDYPSTVAYYQQRIIFGGSINKPETVYTSRTGEFDSMRVAVPTKADDANTFTLASQQVNEVRHIVSIGALLVLTSGGEFKISEGQDQVLTPSTVSARVQSLYGASNVAPVIVDHTAIFIQESGSRVRDIGYTFESDSYTGSDLSIMAQHLFRSKQVVEMAFSQEPFRMIWVVQDDGGMLGLTYHREHKIVGWSRHDTNGLFKSVTTIKEDQENIAYAVIERTIDGNTVRMVERLRERSWTVAEDAFLVDSGLTYDGPETDTITGLYHLKGEAVAVLADGNVVPDITVNDRGAVELPDLASKIHIGLSFISDVKTLNIDSAQRMVKGKAKSVGEAVIQFHESRGGWIGPDETALNEIRPRQQEDDYDSIALDSWDERVAVDSGWTDGGQVFYRQVDPLPFTILAISPDVSVG